MTERLHIIDIGANGDGIARLADGRAVFVPYAAPGDVVLARVEQDGEIFRGRVLSFEVKGEQHATPPCRHFGICGGCSLQHLEEGAYRGYKRDAVLTALAKGGVVAPDFVESVFVPSGTRRRANFAAFVTQGKTIIGFHERKSANIRDVPDCLIIHDDVRRVMEGFQVFLPVIAGEGKKMDVLVQCVEGQAEIALTGKLAPGWEAQQALSDALRTLDLARISMRARDYEAYEILLAAKPYYKRFDSLTVNLAPGAFLQPSEEGEAALTKCVMEGVGDASCIADLFCGNGTFTGPLMKGRDVIAADLAPDAIAALTQAGIDARVRNLFKDPMNAAELSGRECVILDPPRAGASAQVRVLSVPKVVYVSCNVQSFVKDSQGLIDGGYQLEKLSIVDQFIWSPHTEVVGVFTKGV